MNRLVAKGKSIIMISSELPEVLGMCDRILVMRSGRIAGEIAAEHATQEKSCNTPRWRINHVRYRSIAAKRKSYDENK